MQRLSVPTSRKRQVIDITDEVASHLRAFGDGVCVLNVLHTTAALTVADLDPGTDLDILDALDAMIPKLHYRHPHDPAHVPDHILSALVGTSLALPVEQGRLLLGTWQRVVLMEFDGPRNREITLQVISEVRRNP